MRIVTIRKPVEESQRKLIICVFIDYGGMSS